MTNISNWASVDPARIYTGKYLVKETSCYEKLLAGPRFFFLHRDFPVWGDMGGPGGEVIVGLLRYDNFVAWGGADWWWHSAYQPAKICSLDVQPA